MHSLLPEVVSPDKCFTGIDIEHGSGADIDTIQPTIQYLFEKETKIQTFGNAHFTTTSQVQLRPPYQGQQLNLQMRRDLPLAMEQTAVGNGEKVPSMEQPEGMVIHTSFTSSLTPVTQLKFYLSKPYSLLFNIFPFYILGRNQLRQRTQFLKEQTKVLELHFAHSHYVSPERCRELAQLLFLKDEVVRSWFSNKRAKERRLRKRQQNNAHVGRK